MNGASVVPFTVIRGHAAAAPPASSLAKKVGLLERLRPHGAALVEEVVDRLLRDTVLAQSGGAATASQVVSLTVEIEYLHHRKPHHRDDEPRRVEKQTESAAARAHECTVEMEYAKPVDMWTSTDIIAVIDQVRADMPAASPNPEPFVVSSWLDPADAFRDGRALQRVSFYRKHRGAAIWFSTAAGYSAQVEVGMDLPPAALADFACGQFAFFGLRMDLDVRALRRARPELLRPAGEDAAGQKAH